MNLWTINFKIELNEDLSLPNKLIFVGEMPKSIDMAWDISLEKWSILKNPDILITESGGTFTCGLCLYFGRHLLADCGLCPVKVSTGKSNCERTPHDSYSSAVDRYRRAGEMSFEDIAYAIHEIHSEAERMYNELVNIRETFSKNVQEVMLNDLLDKYQTSCWRQGFNQALLNGANEPLRMDYKHSRDKAITEQLAARREIVERFKQNHE